MIPLGNLASLNLLKFYDALERPFRGRMPIRHASRLWTLILEISVYMAQFPSVAVARKSYDFRTLGLGYANLGSLLMVQGMPVRLARKAELSAAALTALMHASAYATSAEIAAEQGTVPALRGQSAAMLHVMPQPPPGRCTTPPGNTRG